MESASGSEGGVRELEFTAVPDGTVFALISFMTMQWALSSDCTSKLGSVLLRALHEGDNFLGLAEAWVFYAAMQYVSLQLRMVVDLFCVQPNLRWRFSLQGLWNKRRGRGIAE